MTQMRLGLAQIVPASPDELTPAVAARIRALGVTALVTHFEVPAADMRGIRGHRLGRVLADAGLGIVQYGGLRPNLVTADAVRRRDSIREIGEFLRTAAFLRADMVVTGCGSHHPDHPYGPSPENYSARSRDLLVSSLVELADRAADTGTMLAMEAHCLTTLESPETVREILDAVDSPWIRANFDPVNFLGSVRAVYSSGAAAQHAARVLQPRLAPAAHIKDVAVEAELVLHIAETVPGTGVLDLPSVLAACRRFLPPPATLIVEHLGAGDVPSALAHVTSVAAGCGIEFG